MAGVGDLGSLTNSGSMPISAGGGASGDATAGGDDSFRIGSINMGNSGKSGVSTTALIVGAFAVLGGYYLLTKKK